MVAGGIDDVFQSCITQGRMQAKIVKERRSVYQSYCITYHRVARSAYTVVRAIRPVNGR